MQLTPEEFAQAEKWLSRMEKNARPWRFLSWMQVVCGLILLCQSVWFFNLWHQQNDLFASSSSKASTRPVDERSLQMELGPAKLQVQSQMLTIGESFLGFWLGSWMTIRTLAQWNRGKKELLIAKGIRVLLEEHKRLRMPQVSKDREPIPGEDPS